MKSTTIVLVLVLNLLFFSRSYSSECAVNGKDLSSDPVAFQAAIASSSTCWEAVQMAEACAWGSSLDVMTVDAAYSICENELKQNSPDAETVQILDLMKNKCTQKYSELEGTMYRSMMSYCHLDAIEWAVNMSYDEDQDEIQ